MEVVVALSLHAERGLAHQRFHSGCSRRSHALKTLLLLNIAGELRTRLNKLGVLARRADWFVSVNETVFSAGLGKTALWLCRDVRGTLPSLPSCGYWERLAIPAATSAPRHSPLNTLHDCGDCFALLRPCLNATLHKDIAGGTVKEAEQPVSDLQPDSAVSYFSVGCFYSRHSYLVGHALILTHFAPIVALPEAGVSDHRTASSSHASSPQVVPRPKRGIY